MHKRTRMKKVTFCTQTAPKYKLLKRYNTSWFLKIQCVCLLDNLLDSCSLAGTQPTDYAFFFGSPFCFILISSFEFENWGLRILFDSQMNSISSTSPIPMKSNPHDKHIYYTNNKRFYTRVGLFNRDINE